MRKLMTFFALALLTLAGCKNSFDGNTAEQKIPANANVDLTLASPERTIAPGKLSEILKSAAKTEEWTFTFTRTDDTSVQDVITKKWAASATTASFTLPTGIYDITAELSYTEATTDATAGITYKIEGKLIGVEVSDTAVSKTINIAFKKTTGETGTLNYTFDFSGWGQVFTGKPVLYYKLVKHGGSVADVEWMKLVELYTETTAEGGTTTKSYLTKHQLNESIDSGYWDIYAKVEGYNADDSNLVYNIPINDNLVEIADGLTSTGSIVVPTPDTSKLYYVSCETDQQYNDNNGTFEFSRVSLLKAFEKAKSLKPSIKDVTFSLDKLKGESLELDASVLATDKTIHFKIASGASFEITPEGHLESASGLTSVTFYTASTASDTASKKTVNMKQSFIVNSYSNTPLDIILKNGVSLNCILSEQSNGVRMNLHVYDIENYLKSPVITLNSTAPCNTTNTFYDAAGTDKTKDYILSKKTVEATGTADAKTEYFIVPAGSGILGTETITGLSVTCDYGSEKPKLTLTDDYTYTGTAPHNNGDKITFTASAANAVSYVWSFYNSDTEQRETLSNTDTCTVNINGSKAIDKNGLITMMVTAADSDGNAASYEVKFIVTGSTINSRNILWDRSTYYAVSDDAIASDLSLSSQTSLGHTVLDFGFDADMNLYTLESGNAAKTLNYYKNGLKGFSSTSSVDVSNTNISKIAITSNKVYASGSSSSSDSSSGGPYLNKFELPLKEDSTANDITSSWNIPDTGEGISNYVFNSLAADDTYLYIGCKDNSSKPAPLYVIKYDLDYLNTIAGIAKLDTSNLVKTADGVTTDITDMIAQDGKLYVLAAVYYKVDTGYCSKFNGNMYEIDPASITGTTVPTDTITASLLVKFNELDVTVNDGTTTKIACPYPSKFVAVMPGKLKIAIDGGISTTIGGITEHTDEDYVVTYDIAGKTATGVKFNNNMFDFEASGSGFTK
ncbi:hypothetical protein [uncultured Treponema sp.]|uniref:hypothetical protein n=1 Tax=uncultured Treponema sp. TaxID=162155 RepID=UPI0027D9C939|nr:hypothetical protein [uncultured Treponema sp.]